MNFSIDADAGCGYECYIDKPHQHILIVDETPPSELEQELQRMRIACYRESYFAETGRYPMSVVEHLFAITPVETPFISLISENATAKADKKARFVWEKEE